MTWETGQRLPTRTFRVTRADLVRYAGASGDFNPIHWSERGAREVGLPGVIAHGMFTMALVGEAVTTWAGSPDAVVELGVRFARPVPVPDDDTGTEVEVTATVASVSEGTGAGPEPGGTAEPGTAPDGAGMTAELALTATCAGQRVLSQARARVRLGSPPGYPYTGSA